MEPITPLYQRADFQSSLSDILRNTGRYQYYKPKNRNSDAVVFYSPEEDSFFVPDLVGQLKGLGESLTQNVIEYALFKTMNERLDHFKTSFEVVAVNQAINEIDKEPEHRIVFKLGAPE